MKVPDVIARAPSKRNLTETFKESPKYELLTYMRKRVFDNINIQKHGYIKVKLEPADFHNSEELLQKSKFLGGLSLHLNHLIALGMTIYDWPFGTLLFRLFGSNLDTRDLETYPRTYSGHF